MKMVVTHEVKYVEKWVRKQKGASKNYLQICQKYCRIYNRLVC